jgi:hypothetical protein
MKTSQVAASLFCLTAVLGFSPSARAQNSGSLLGNIINEAVRQQQQQQGEDPRYNNRYSDDDDDYYNDRHYDTRRVKRVTCESQKGRHNYCPVDTRGRVRIERQLSNAPCREYDTWGVDGDGGGVWVGDGCRAVFVVEPRKAETYGKHGRGRRDVITCESPRGRHQYCPTNAYGRIRLERQLSDAPCREYDTWGSDDDGNGVWVSDGCRAEFSVGEGRGYYGRGDRD